MKDQMADKYCKNCVHAKREHDTIGYGIYYCFRKNSSRTSLVDGTIFTNQNMEKCWRERGSNGPAFCGPSGKYWVKAMPKVGVWKKLFGRKK